MSDPASAGSADGFDLEAAKRLGVVHQKLRTLPMDRVHILRMAPAAARALFLTVMDYIGHTIEKELKSVRVYLEMQEGIGGPRPVSTSHRS